MESEKILSSNMQSLLLRKYNEIGVAKIFNTSIQPTARKKESERQLTALKYDVFFERVTSIPDTEIA